MKSKQFKEKSVGALKKAVTSPQAFFIDWHEVQRMLKWQAKGTEIAKSLGIGPETLYDRCLKENGMSWMQYSQMYKEKGLKSVRETQFYVALQERNPTMLIFLGKNYLGQRDRFDHNVEGNITINHVHYTDPEEEAIWNNCNTCEYDDDTE